ncbi:hypothetical protein HY732_03210 [Candidatus Uhrbacteria bacterium]|nr:hypothetical protein [Candidatus Uhrbacteria bacterium]
MDVRSQSHNDIPSAQNDLEYDPLLEEGEKPVLELDDFFSDANAVFPDETIASSNEPFVYDSSASGIDSVPVPDTLHDEGGYVDETDYAVGDDAVSEMPVHTGLHQQAFRLTAVERTLQEIQKYIGELLVLVRKELQTQTEKKDAPREEKPPFPDFHEYEATESSYDTPVPDEGDSGVPTCGRSLEYSDRMPEMATYIGIFNGSAMVTSDGREFSVPENYASKSRLVQGDELKLTLSREGAMAYKQTGPAPRRRITGILEYDPVEERYTVLSNRGRFCVLTASVMFFKGVPGDAVLLIIPVGSPCQWGAIQSLIKNTAV